MRMNVYAHEPLTDSGWQPVAVAVSPDEAANLMRSWGSRGWRVLCLSEECEAQGWDMNWPALAPAAPPKPRRAPSPRKASTKTGWADPEAKKVRTKTLSAINAQVQKRGAPFSYNADSRNEYLAAYAEALGVTSEQAAEKINFHDECLAIWQRSGGMVARP